MATDPEMVPMCPILATEVMTRLLRNLLMEDSNVRAITVQFGIVRQSHVTRASDVPKYGFRHMSQSPLTKGQNLTS